MPELYTAFSLIDHQVGQRYILLFWILSVLRKNILHFPKKREATVGRPRGLCCGSCLKNSGLFPELLAGLWSEDPIVRMRAADAAEKVTRKNPQLLQPFKKELLGLMADAGQQELRWHLAVMIPRLPLTSWERQRATSLLNSYLEDRSSIVKTLLFRGLPTWLRLTRASNSG